MYNFCAVTRKAERTKMKIKEASFVIGFFARFNLENGIEDLLAIAIRLKKYDSSIKIVVYGFESKIVSEQVRQIAEQMPNNVILTGMISDVSNKMQMIDVLISPFKTAHFSRSVIEAQALSIPVLVSNVKSQNTLLEVDKTGYIYNVGNINEALNKIKILKEDTNLLAVMKQNARVFAVDNFCHLANNKKVYAIYKNLLTQE